MWENMREGHWESYALMDGLPSVNVYAILEDREGKLWFASGEWQSEFEGGGGVSQCDGRSFVNFTTDVGWDVVYECNEMPLEADPAWELREGNDAVGTIVPNPDAPGNSILFVDDGGGTKVKWKMAWPSIKFSSLKL